MTCCQGIECFFDDKTASKQLKKYRKKGPDKETKILIKNILQDDLSGKNLLDIGGGVGCIHHELIKNGVSQALVVDASSSYIKASQSEAERYNHLNKLNYIHGNFIELSENIPEKDIVTLDKVICCYPDMIDLVEMSISKSKRIYGVVYPRKYWITKIMWVLSSLYSFFKRNPLKLILHSPEEIDNLIRSKGFVERFRSKLLFWYVVVYSRQS